jgi:hypothetical protein
MTALFPPESLGTAVIGFVASLMSQFGCRSRRVRQKSCFLVASYIIPPRICDFGHG